MVKSRTIDRSNFYTVQTPQVFQMAILKKAYTQEWNATFTDDASVVEKKGYQVVMVPGDRENLKVTHPEDLVVANAYLKRKKTPK